MERYYKILKKGDDTDVASGSGNATNDMPCSSPASFPNEVNLDELPYDPGERKKISEYHPNQRDEVRRKYLLKGPCQPRGHTFPIRNIGNIPRHFMPSWFDEYADWLEYSVKADKAFCLCCYLLRDQFGKQKGSEAFVSDGFSCWNKPERLPSHVGGVNSFHNKARKRCDDLMNQRQSIAVVLNKQDDVTKKEQRVRLNASIKATRFLLRQGLSFRGHDESEKSKNRGNFLELIDYTAGENEDVANVVLKNAPLNKKMTSPDIQKDIALCFTQEVLKYILEDVGDDVFALLVDESTDCSHKQQMSVVLRYVDSSCIVKERFVGIVHVKETTSLSLKVALDSLLVKLGLSLKKVRGQGYDGASNMRGDLGGLKTLVMNETSSAYYVHCFAHQLQLVVVKVVRENKDVVNFFDMISLLLNVVGGSCKRRDMLRESHQKKVMEAICKGERSTGSGLNQEVDLSRPGTTRWNSHYKTLIRVVEMFESIVFVLEYVSNECTDSTKRSQAEGLLKYFQTFDSVFYLHLLLHLLGLTDDLSRALQKKDQDISNAMAMVASTKRLVQLLRDEGWDSLLHKISAFCEKMNKVPEFEDTYEFSMVNMEEFYIDPLNKRAKNKVTNYDHYHHACFLDVIDLMRVEFDDRFSEVNSELLTCISSLSPIQSFYEFDPPKLMRLAEFYPDDFDVSERKALQLQLPLYIDYLRSDGRFANLKSLTDLARVLGETRKHLSYPSVYRLLKLALTLPIGTATVERSFSAMKIVKTNLHNRMGDAFLNSCLVYFIESDLLEKVTNEVVLNRFQKMKRRREEV